MFVFLLLYVIITSIGSDIVPNTEDINRQIKEGKESGVIRPKLVSDTHHTFKDLYRRIAVLFGVLCSLKPEISWKSRKHFDEENDPMFNGDFLVGINTPKGVAAFHFKLQYWDLFSVPEIERAPEYDGYSEEDVLERLLSLIAEENEKTK